MKSFIAKLLKSVTVMTLILMACTVPAYAEEELNWVEGGQKVDVGTNLAELQLGSDFIFLDAENTKKYITQSGMELNGEEIGVVFPKDEKQNWAVYFEYTKSGHIKDDEKKDIDADALLESYKEGTKEMNKELSPENQLFVDKWDVPPFYDNDLHSLSWSLLAHDNQNNGVINYNVRLLSREGYISAILVSDPENLKKDRIVFNNKILSQFNLKKGQRYEDFDSKTDKVAEFGLTGLILGGAGLAVAKKVGFFAIILPLLKKFWIVLVLAVGAIWAFIRKKLGLKNEQSEQQPTQLEQQEQSEQPAQDQASERSKVNSHE
ncbi:DUF2167 domain-containing protein [Lysinibacillus sp. CNPSo 3705]|uniref:DUF2167 domain-containing protein n=1 Tax=Lysinibacillus sp. CNPSo 3705 TaxID=3028148 RepID=UPI0023641E36|nr:DUF2167 domain-containing protein [Lysinibacillus sp. CNPSo 3705]MDD1503121.1 DUF2167 domain-containing protein [Lysinibacillus sp. CNPSo 3705]